MWGKRILTVSAPPITHLLKVVDPRDPKVAEDPHAVQNHFHIRISNVQTDATEGGIVSGMYMDGYVKPFLGATTPLALDNPLIRIDTTDPAVAKIKRGVTVAKWNPSCTDGSVDQIIDTLVGMILKQHCDSPYKMLKSLCGCRKRGCLEHHARCNGFLASIMPNGTWNWLTRCKINMDSHTYLHAANANIPFNYLWALLETNVCVHAAEETTRERILYPKELWVVTVNCEYCMREETIRYTPCTKNNVTEAMLKIPDILRMKQSTVDAIVAAYTKYESSGPIVPLHDEDISDIDPCLLEQVAFLQLLRHYVYSSMFGIGGSEHFWVTMSTQEALYQHIGKEPRPPLGQNEIRGIRIDSWIDFLILLAETYGPNGIMAAY
jgi:hypothetical protein